jgi:Na+-driven multidrug efflux pump
METKKEKVNVFQMESIPKAVMTMALPSMLSMLVNILYNMADTFFIAQTHNTHQLAAVQLATPAFIIISAMGSLFGVGGCAFISRSLGSGDNSRVKKISSFCVWSSAAAGLVLSMIILIFMHPILSLLGSNVNTDEYASQYLSIICYAGILVVPSLAFSNLVRGEGAAKISMIGMMLGTVVNIILDPIMILTMNLGVRGAALATVIGNVCALLFYIVYMLKSNTILSMNPKDIRIKGIASGVLSVGFPASITTILMSLSNILMNNYINKTAVRETLEAITNNDTTHIVFKTASELITAGNFTEAANQIATSAIASMGVAQKANMLLVFLQMGLAIGVQPLFAYNYGARNYKKLNAFLRFSIIFEVIMGTILTIIYFIFTEQIIRIFNSDPAVLYYGKIMLRALMIAGPFCGIVFVINNALQGMNKGIQSLILAISRQGFIFLPIVIIGSQLVGLSGIVYAQPIADILSIVLAVIMFVICIKSEKKKDAALAVGKN